MGCSRPAVSRTQHVCCHSAGCGAPGWGPQRRGKGHQCPDPSHQGWGGGMPRGPLHPAPRPAVPGGDRSPRLGVQSVEDASAAAGPALQNQSGRQAAVRETGAVWHSGHFSTSIKPEGRGGRVGSPPRSPGCGCLLRRPPHPTRNGPCWVSLGPAPPAGDRGHAACGGGGGPWLGAMPASPPL